LIAGLSKIVELLFWPSLKKERKILPTSIGNLASHSGRRILMGKRQWL
jgi:hypothetical protein